MGLIDPFAGAFNRSDERSETVERHVSAKVGFTLMPIGAALIILGLALGDPDQKKTLPIIVSAIGMILFIGGTYLLARD